MLKGGLILSNLGTVGHVIPVGKLVLFHLTLRCVS